MIQASGLSLSIGSQQILRDVSLTAEAGEVTALIGPNGAGKSSLLKALCGDSRRYNGRITLAERCLHAWRSQPSALARLRAVMPQFHPLNFALTVAEVVALGRLPHQGENTLAQDRRIARQAMSMIGMEPFAHRRYTELSGGQQARVQFARMLAQLDCGYRERGILFLDEPTANLDLRYQLLLMQVTRELAGRGIAVVAVLHDLNLAARFADRIVALKEGQLVAQGSVARIYQDDILTKTFDIPIRVTNDHPAGHPLVGVDQIGFNY